jgi:chemotaxis signal transduction protein
MMNAAEAWLVECGNVRVFVSAVNMQHVIEHAGLHFAVPMTPKHCNSVLVWQQQVLPVVNLAEMMSQSAMASCAYSCVMGWQDIERGTEYGVLAASKFPQRVMIHDSHCVEPAVEIAHVWQGLAMCFVEYNNKQVPIIDVARLFGASQFSSQSGMTTLGMSA